MSCPVVLHPLGRLDLLDAVAWYEEQRTGLGWEMWQQVHAAMRAAGERPESFEIMQGLARRVLVRRFPFAVYFRFDGKAVVVMAIVHVRRDPERWRERFGV